MTPEIHERLAELTCTLKSAMETLAATLAHNHEVVLYDLTSPEKPVIKMINGRISDPTTYGHLLKEPAVSALMAETKSIQPSIVSMTTTSSDTHTPDSASAVYYDEGGQPLLLFRINVDKSPYQQINRAIDGLCGPVMDHHVTVAEKRCLTTQAIQTALKCHLLSKQKLTKAQRQQIISELYMKGIFKMKGAVQSVALALDVTRYTVYNDLEVMHESGKKRSG